jgi:hypothetical protein
MKKQTKRKRYNKINRRRNKTKKNHRRRNTIKRRRNLSESIPGNKGRGVRLFSIPEKQKPFKIILDNNHNKQFGNIIPGLREM